MASTEAQYKALAITPKITSTLSIGSSVFIIKEAIAEHRRHKGKATLRALIGMSVIDILASIGWFLSTWAAPVGSDAVYAVGNTQTCTFQGFLLQIAIGAPLYNGVLALYYLLTIKYGWREEDLKRIEPYLHGSVLLFTFGTGILLIPLDVYNHIGTVCWSMGLPQGCGNSNRTPSDVPCERGNNAWIYGVALFYGPLWLCFIFTTVAMIMIYKKVRATEKRNLRYSGAQGQSLRQIFSMSDKIAVQAILYTVAFYLTWLPSTMWSIATWFGSPMFWLDMLACIFEPSQGSFNLCVFLRPRPALRLRLYNQLCCFCRRNSFDATGSTTQLSDDGTRSKRTWRTASASRSTNSDVKFASRDAEPSGDSNGSDMQVGFKHGGKSAEEEQTEQQGVEDANENRQDNDIMENGNATP